MTITPHPVLTRITGGNLWLNLLQMVTAPAPGVPGYWFDANGWLQGPDVRTKPIPEAATQPEIVPHSAILHTNAGKTGARSLWAYITRKDVTGEPHFQVGYDVLEQYMPVIKRADCNYSANRWKAKLASGAQVYRGAVSFETQDNGAATLDKTPWSPRQQQHLIGALTALCVCYGVQCTAPAVWDSSGIGHHTLHPFQGVGHPAWTNVRGKTCPGRQRIAQMDHIRAEVARRLALFADATGGAWKCGGR